MHSSGPVYFLYWESGQTGNHLNFVNGTLLSTDRVVNMRTCNLWNLRRAWLTLQITPGATTLQINAPHGASRWRSWYSALSHTTNWNNRPSGRVMIHAVLWILTSAILCSSPLCCWHGIWLQWWRLKQQITARSVSWQWVHRWPSRKKEFK